MGELVNIATAALSGQAPGVSSFGQQQLAPVTSAQQQALRQRDSLASIAGLLGQAENINNSYLQNRTLKYDPSYGLSLPMMGERAVAMGRGEIPLTVGGKHYSARDLGMTSDDIMRQGSDVLATTLKADEAFNPFHYSTDSMLFSPADLLARRDANDYYNFDIRRQRDLVKSQMASVLGAAAKGAATGAVASGIF